jgi:hypothetical protein
VKPTFPLIALLATAACGGVVSSSSARAVDGGAACVQPTVMPLVVSPGRGGATGFLEVDLGDVAPGLGPVVLASVRLRPSVGLASLDFVEGARLFVKDSALGPGALLAAGGSRQADGLSMTLPPAVDLRALAPGGVLAVSLELEGMPPESAVSVTLDVCVHPQNPHDVL